MAGMEVQGAEELIARFTKIGRLSTVKAGMGQACAIVERAAKEKAPKSSGALRRSITSAVEETGTDITGVISTPLEYAPYRYVRSLNRAKSGKPKQLKYQTI